jgi:rSAM/selenodomain-associated transferase 2
MAGEPKMISVVIPVLNEAQNLPRLLAVLGRETAAHEVIVVDGGSRDMTVDEARKFDAQVVESQPGRGVQLRCGADAATGDVLLFLHADSEFPAGGLDRIVENLAMSPAVIGGNFRLLFSGEARFSRWLTRYYAWIRRRGLYYGDSAIFVRRDVYDAIGGMRPIALMEDFDFVRRMERFGRTVCVLEPPLVTSSRRFEGRNSIAIVFGWLRIHALYHLGVSPDRLASIYYSRRFRRAISSDQNTASHPESRYDNH